MKTIFFILVTLVTLIIIKYSIEIITSIRTNTTVELLNVTNTMNRIYYDTDIDEFKGILRNNQVLLYMGIFLRFRIRLKLWYANLMSMYFHKVYLVSIMTYCNPNLIQYLALKYHLEGYYVIEREPFLDMHEYLTIIPKNLVGHYKNLDILPRQRSRADLEGYTIEIINSSREEMDK